MSMLTLARKSLWNRRVTAGLVVLSIALSVVLPVSYTHLTLPTNREV